VEKARRKPKRHWVGEQAPSGKLKRVEIHGKCFHPSDYGNVGEDRRKTKDLQQGVRLLRKRACRQRGAKGLFPPFIHFNFPRKRETKGEKGSKVLQEREGGMGIDPRGLPPFTGRSKTLPRA